jgi:Right handed beta helix region
MNRFAATGVLALALFTPLPVLATAQRTFVASTGNDANACSLNAPFRSFAAAIAQRNNGGEVIVLDSAGYGPASITHAVSLIAPAGIYAGISVFAGDGLTINAPGGKVVLRGLTINGQGGNNGINFAAGAGLHVESCEVSGLLGTGVRVSAPGTVVHILDSIVRENSIGILIEGTTSTTMANISRTRVENNGGEGIEVTGGAEVAVEDSIVTGSVFNIDAYTTIATAFIRMTVARTLVHGGAYGILAEPLVANVIIQIGVSDSTVSDTTQVGIGAIPLGASSAIINVVRTEVIGNNIGLKADSTHGGATLVMDGNTIMHNQEGVVANGLSSTLHTRGNNAAKNNTFDDVLGTTNFFGGI